MPGKPADTAHAAARGARTYLWRPVEIVRSYRRRDLSPDLIAGVTVAAVAIPRDLGQEPPRWREGAPRAAPAQAVGRWYMV